ncbi:J domain-containing protein [Desulfovibrio sp.]|uniref:J domain-containing protein n=1 Tax=Desulfovibrio sp. TaxID=885 RepID=UPI0025BFA9FF|nr:J domain-containing protein [Desulfovibrio sp.]
MRRRSRQISLKECYEILKLEKNADLAAVKRAYRRRAFELHPDLNPGNAEASRDFQMLNEAYVALSGILKHEDGIRATSEARKAAQKAKKNAAQGDGSDKKPGPAADAGQTEDKAPPPPDGTGGAEAAGQQQAKTAGADAGSQTEQQKKKQQNEETTGSEENATDRNGTAGAAYAEQDVLRDLLNDPFARRVFEDIYSELNRQHAEKPQQETAEAHTAESAPQSRARPKAAQKEKRSTPLHKSNLAWGTTKWSSDMTKGVTGMVRGWLRRQIDEEQSLTLPAANLAPGCRVRLQIRQGIQAELKTVEITLPPDFTVGKPIRLRGLGKRIGPWQGDLYLTLYTE